MINAFITMQGVVRIRLTPEVPALGEGSDDECALRSLFLDEQSYFSEQKMPAEVIGVIESKTARGTLFDNGTAKIHFWKSKKNLTAKWAKV